MNSESESEPDDVDEVRVKELEKDEPLLKENPGRFVILPIQYHDIWAFYKKAVGKRFAPFNTSRILYVLQLHFGQWKKLIYLKI